MAFFKCHWRWIVFVLLLVLGLFNGYIAILSAAISVLIIIKSSKGSVWLESPSLLLLTLCSVLLGVISAAQAFDQLNPYKTTALNELIVTIGTDSGGCMPATEEDRVQWQNITNTIGLICSLENNKEHQAGVYKIHTSFLGAISNSFSLASTFFSDPPAKSRCLVLLDDYQRICPCVPGSKFDEQLTTFKKNYVLPNDVHPGMIDQKTCNSK